MKLLRHLAAPPFVYHPAYSCPWPSTHRFPMAKFRLLRDVIVNSGIHSGDFHSPPHPFDESSFMEAVYLAHDRDYIDRFCNDKLTMEEKRMINLDFNEHLVYRTFSEMGGTLHATQLALQYGMAINGAGGTHHAHASFGSGFTVVNDLAIAAKYLIHTKLCGSVLIFDLDVHQGDGTATICAKDSNIFTCSIHCSDNFPFKKAQSDLDVGLSPGIEDKEYLETVRLTLSQALTLSDPDFVLYDAGVDISEHDVLGRLRVSDRGIFERDLLVLSECRRRKIPVCGVIGGGYDRDLTRLAARHSLLHRAAIHAWNMGEES